jgi:hypothetical protein
MTFQRGRGVPFPTFGRVAKGVIGPEVNRVELACMNGREWRDKFFDLARCRKLRRGSLSQSPRGDVHGVRQIGLKTLAMREA